ncbi:hypothetical protein LUZ60_012710 [Juncus effusus]|nr:hypothetical protein LUZ60_012710 [Juncus effusus]
MAEIGRKTADPAKIERKRSKEPGVRVIGGRIYDPQHGKTCHQCRQKTMDFAVSCTQMKKDKICTIKYCHKCLINRYGENAEEKAKLGDWICPKCRDVCNCSFCMKKKGQAPTGIMTHTVKASGFSSVLEFLKSSPKVEAQKRKFEEGKENKNEEKKAKKELFKKTKNKLNNIDLNSPAPINEEETEENNNNNITLNENNNNSNNITEQNSDKNTIKLKPSLILKKHNKVNYAMEKLEELEREGKNLPSGSHLSVLAGAELAPEETGLALQFLEFSRTFSKVLNMKKGQADCIIQEIIKGRIGRRGLSSVLIQFQINLLSLIQTDLGEKPVSAKNGDEWLKCLSSYIEEYKNLLPKIPLDSLNEGILGYDNLESVQKFQILNFLCDEALNTEKFRDFIEGENLKSKEEMKSDKEKIQAAKRKERELKEKLRNDLAKNILLEREKDSSLSIEEHQKIVSEIKNQTDQAHADLLDTMDNVSNKKERRDAMRTEPLISDGNGRIYYKLDGYVNGSSILRQDVEKWEDGKNGDMWFCFSEEEEKVIDMHISSVRKWQKSLNSALKPPRKDKKILISQNHDQIISQNHDQIVSENEDQALD